MKVIYDEKLSQKTIAWFYFSEGRTADNEKSVSNMNVSTYFATDWKVLCW